MDIIFHDKFVWVEYSVFDFICNRRNTIFRRIEIKFKMAIYEKLKEKFKDVDEIFIIKTALELTNEECVSLGEWKKNGKS